MFFFLSFIIITGDASAIVPKFRNEQKRSIDSAVVKVDSALLINPTHDMEMLVHEVREKRIEVVFTLITIVGLSMFIALLYIDRRRKKKMLVQQKEFAESQANLLKERLEATNKELTSKAL
ncbi:MAG: hypothetical protein WCL00_08320, partial [Bacteroidota bacterium]